MENRNKFLAIAIALLIMAGVAAGVYFIFFAPQNPDQNIDQSGALKMISEDVVVSPLINRDGSAVWYFNQRGQLYRRSLDGSSLNEYTLPSLVDNFSSAIWPKNGNDIILVSIAGTTEQKFLYDYDLKDYVKLPTNIKSLDWTPDGERVVYVWKSGDNKTQQLIVANPDASGFRSIASLPFSDFEIKVSPGGDRALLFRKAEGENRLYLAYLNSGGISPIIEASKDAEWISSDKFAFVNNEGGQPKMGIYDINTKQIIDLNLVSTMDKTASDAEGKFIYTAATVENKTVLMKIDSTNNKQERLYEFDPNFQPKNLMVSGQMVVFTNALDGKLYYILN